MADQIAASEVHASGSEPETSADGRAYFAAPVVQDLGGLKTLTLQDSVIIEP